MNNKIGLKELLLIICIIACVALCVTLKVGGPMIGLFFGWICIYLYCKIAHYDFEDTLKGGFDAIRVVVPTLCLLMAIGVMIGTWLQCGTISTIITIGLKVINPKWLLLLTLIFCAVLSVLTGTSYGSVASMGVAMMAIGTAMGIHPGMIAGSVICGAMFGDKISPLSDTTNLAAAVSGAKLRDHVKSMLWTTIPAFVITAIIFIIIGLNQNTDTNSIETISSYIEALNNEFSINAFTLIPVIVIIASILLKVNAIISIGISSIVAGIISYICQGHTLAQILSVAYSGYKTSIDIGPLQSILNRGGMSSMLQYIAIICFAVGIGGMLDKLGILHSILNSVTKHIKNDGGLILTTLIVGYITSIVSCSQPMAHVMTGKLMQPLYKERKIAPEILSRSIEDSGTLAGPMIPWHGYCIYMAGVLGVAWKVFFPYLFMLYITPIFSITYGYTGLSIKHEE